jgi:hypothetical protein
MVAMTSMDCRLLLQRLNKTQYYMQSMKKPLHQSKIQENIECNQRAHHFQSMIHWDN